MSKSRGTFILARDYLKHLNPEYLRYYFAAKLGSGIDDIDLNFDDFVKRNNSDLIGKVVNIASRLSCFINKNFEGTLSSHLNAPELFTEGLKLSEKIGESYETRNFSHAVRLIMHLADLANQYIDEKKPWNISKQNPNDPAIQDICTMGLNIFRLLVIFLKPILPVLAANSEKFLQVEPLTWEDRKTQLLNHKINNFEPLMQRIDPKNIEQLLS